MDLRASAVVQGFQKNPALLGAYVRGGGLQACYCQDNDMSAIGAQVSHHECIRVHRKCARALTRPHPRRSDSHLSTAVRVFSSEWRDGALTRA